MKNDKISFLKEKELNKKADEFYKKFNSETSAQNPIEAKFRAFEKVKQDIKIKDLF